LYALRSARNWGVGDFTDLAQAIVGWAREGAAVIGLNPLHALFPHNPAHVSPYSPSSRLFVNPLYLDVEAIEDFAACDEARARVGSPAFQERLRALRETPLVDYPGVAQAKREVLLLLHRSFRRRHATAGTARAKSFERFRQERGDALARHALFEALQAHFHDQDPSVWGWPAWPDRYRDPSSSEVAAFARDHETAVDFYAWLQWQADLQRARAAEVARREGMALGV
jgi:(1->4)-alpha-D-glucan 1-alpha-D-glucosylmutase